MFALGLPPPPPPTTVTLTLVIPVGTVNVPDDVNTWRLPKPPAGAAALVQAVPLEVKILPDVPGELKPVPPSATVTGVVTSIAGDTIPVSPFNVIGMLCSYF
jgi:hypothetical protein